MALGTRSRTTLDQSFWSTTIRVAVPVPVVEKVTLPAVSVNWMCKVNCNLVPSVLTVTVASVLSKPAADASGLNMSLRYVNAKVPVSVAFQAPWPLLRTTLPVSWGVSVSMTIPSRVKLSRMGLAPMALS